MRTGRLAGVAINKTVCNRRIRQHFFQQPVSLPLPEIAFMLARQTSLRDRRFNAMMIQFSS